MSGPISAGAAGATFTVRDQTATLVSVGNDGATVLTIAGLWDDICTLSPSAVNPTGPDGSMTVITDPTGYIGALQADAVGESCTVVWQLDHRYKLGTDVKPHIHVVRNDGSDNTGDVEFEAKFRVVPLRGTAFAWTGNVAGSTALQPADGADKSGIISWTLSNATYGFGISDRIYAVIRRSGTTTGSVAVDSCDVHGQLGQPGSSQEGSL